MVCGMLLYVVLCYIVLPYCTVVFVLLLLCVLAYGQMVSFTWELMIRLQGSTLQ